MLYSKMFDKVKFFIPRCEGTKQFRLITERLKEEDPEAISTANAKTGKTKAICCGHLGSLFVAEYLSGLSINGSLTKYANNGSNAVNMTIEETMETLSELQDTYHIDLMSAHVSGLEFGWNFVMKNEPSAYFPLLGEMPRRVRKEYKSETVYWQRKGMERDTFTLYNKVREAQRKKMAIPSYYEGMNLLRAELRLKNGLAMQLKMNEVTGENLTEDFFISKLVNCMCDKYNSISKLNSINLEEIKNGLTEREYVFMYFSVLHTLVGSQFPISNFMADVRKKKVFKNQSQYTRLEKKLNGILSSVKLSDGDPLRAELDGKFELLKNTFCI